MKILVTGNMGYVGPVLIQRLRRSYPGVTLGGLDMGYFANCLTASEFLPESRVDYQLFGDVRQCDPTILAGADAIVYLAAISNDPMGASFEEVTLDVNHRAAIRLADQARRAGVKSFVYASSCSVYGFAEGGHCSEATPLNPLTAYARSKALAEQDLAKMADGAFTVTCLRFATACGMSERLRLDLVLNDFVACALVTHKIAILSDGTPWRPLIHVKDMARAIEWGISREPGNGGEFLTINVGSNQWNYQVRELAEAVASVTPGTDVSINRNAQPDKRSYRVSFDKFEKLAPDFQPQVHLIDAVNDLRSGLDAMAFNDANFRTSEYVRLNVLRRLTSQGHLTKDLEWVHRNGKVATGQEVCG